MSLKSEAKQLVANRGPSICLEFTSETITSYSHFGEEDEGSKAYEAFYAEVRYQAERTLTFLLGPA